MHSGTATAFSSRLDEVSPNGQILPITPTLKIFSYAELKKATSKFSPDTLLGEGGFGKVFKGWIDEKTFAPTKAGSGMAIAVKKLNSDGFQGHEEWQSEVNILGSLSHPNIVRLLGYCREDKERLLVYEFMPRGSLSNHLFSRGSAFQSLSWSIRLKIAIGAARAIAFLHCSERKIISRGVKPSNILLDSNYDAKISNFGLAKNGPVGENSHVSTRVMGTYGYAAPEYVATAISRNNSNEGTHSGSTSAFSSSMNEVSPKIFSFAELKKATRKFSRDTFLGDGGFGQVFKGWIDEKTLAQTKAGCGMAIAVKKMNSESWQGREEWQSEVNFLGSFSHPNVVRLLGHCEEDKELLLVYEFMPRGTLENHLFRISGAFPGGSFSSKLCETFGMLLGRQRITTCIMPRGDLESHLFRRCSAFQPLSWSIRLKIAIGVAQGLAFLHTSERPIIYRDVKTSNILLDLNYNAKLADFGLAMSGPYESSYVSTCVVGTYGYAAPEYVAAGHLYVKSDVYGFGVVLLEMLSGLRAVDKNRPSGKQNLVEWAQPYLSDQRKLLSRVMDKRLEGQYPSEGAVQAAQLILKCLVSQPRKRPSMTEVVETLEQIKAIKQMP